ATADKDLGMVASKTAGKAAQEAANEEGKAVTVRHPVTDKVIAKVLPKAPKAKAAPKANGKAKAKANGKAKAAPKAKVAAKPKAERKPAGMVKKSLKLTSRKDGVSPAELNKVTEWKGAPWKWLFSNPKGNGYCDRWGYKFKVTRTDDGETRYCVTPK